MREEIAALQQNEAELLQEKEYLIVAQVYIILKLFFFNVLKFKEFPGIYYIIFSVTNLPLQESWITERNDTVEEMRVLKTQYDIKLQSMQADLSVLRSSNSSNILPVSSSLQVCVSSFSWLLSSYLPLIFTTTKL